jgi:hypothetical protein
MDLPGKPPGAGGDGGSLARKYQYFVVGEVSE